MFNAENKIGCRPYSLSMKKLAQRTSDQTGLDMDSSFDVICRHAQRRISSYPAVEILQRGVFRLTRHRCAI